MGGLIRKGRPSKGDLLRPWVFGFLGVICAKMTDKKIPAPGPGYQNKGMAIKIKTHYGVCKLAENEKTLGWLHAPQASSRQTLHGGIIV